MVARTGSAAVRMSKGKRKIRARSQGATGKNISSTVASPFQGVRVTAGLPLPRDGEFGIDVSPPTRWALEQMYEFSRGLGIEVRELKVKGLNVAENHNKLALGMWGEWLLIVGSDHDFGYNALSELLSAAMNKPYPRILAGTLPRRDPPYNYVVMTIGKHRQLPAPIVPFLDYHPGQQFAGQLLGAGQDGHPLVVGSGFTLYHRSVFSTCKYPWFQFACREAPETMVEETLYDWDGEISFSAYLEKIAGGEEPVDREKLEAKAMALRRLLGQSRASVAWGPDYGMCMKALDHGIMSYVHLGVPARHYDRFAIHPGMFLKHIRESESNWWTEGMRRLPSITSDNLLQLSRTRQEYLAGEKQTAAQLEEEYNADAQRAQGHEDAEGAREKNGQEAAEKEQEVAEVPA